MKRILSLALMIIIPFSLFAQAYLNYLPKEKNESELTFYDYQAAFNKWCQVKGIDNTGFYSNSKGERQKAYGWKQFRRWEIQMKGWYDRETGRFLYNEVNKEILRVNEQKALNPRDIGGNWTSVAYTQEGSGNSGNGRINCIAFHPTDPDVFWVGTAWGGIWKTEDHGNSWTPLSDEIITLGIGSIAIPFNYDQTQTIYLGTGDRGYNRDYGRGILKSTDGGQTWQQTGLSYDTILPLYINKLMFVPGTANQMIACTDEGIFRTNDGFQTWDTILTCFGMDMEFNPGNPNIIYVSTRGVDKNTKIYRTDNGGISWNVVMSAYGCRTELAVSPDEPSWVYAVVADTSESFKEILKSTNSGISFGVVFDDYNILGGDCNGYQGGGQANYDLAIAASPTNANLVFVGGINVWKSTTGGTTWSINTNGYDNCGVTMSVHVDIHWLDFQELTDELFVTSDGGIYFSDNDGFSYTNISGGLQINQPYKISCSQLSYDEILMGQQDNGIALWNDGDIDFVGGGDGGTTLINPLDANNQYYSNNTSGCYFTTNHWASTHTFTTPGDNTNDWFKPIVIRPPDSVYYGAHDLWMSDEKGYDMTKIMDLQDTTTIHKIAVAPTNPNIIFVVNKEHLWRSQTGGFTKFDLNANLPVSPEDITNIEIKETDPDVVWISAADEWGTGKGVFRSADRGMTWTNISAGLPKCPIADVIQNDLQTGYEELYACCWFGTYVKLGDNPWMPYNNGQPDVISFDIDIYYAGSNSKLRAGTHGRGIWESSLFSADNSQPFVWTGKYNSDWNDFRNWNYMTVPSTDVDVIIPQGTVRNAHIYTSNAWCRNIVIKSGARLNISDRQLIVSNDMEINNELRFFGELARVNVEGNITWKNGSSFEASDTACIITVSGDWKFETGAQADLTGAIVKFVGSDFSNLYTNSSLSKFGRLVVNKPAPYSLSFEDPSSEDLVIMDDLIVSVNCKYYQNSIRNLIVLGDLFAEGDFFQQHGNTRFRNSASLKLVQSSSYLNNLFIDNSSLITLLSNIKIRGNLDIRSGVLNADSYEVKLLGDLYKDIAGSISMTTGRLTFSGTSEQRVWDDFDIKTVEIDKISDTLRITTGRNMVFENFDWTSGAISLDADTYVEMGELIDDGIWGSYVVKANAIFDIYNPTGSVDLNGKLVIAGGKVNVYGGNHASYWPGSANAELHLSSGTLDFKDRGIFVLDHPTLTFLDNITGGVIRSVGGFQGDHHSFNPAGGYIEIYGAGNAGLGHGIGSSLFEVKIDKGTGTVEVTSDLDIDDDLQINTGELDINGFTADVSGLMLIYGKLTMNLAGSELHVGDGINWYPASSADITDGLITFQTFFNFKSGTNAQLLGNNIVKAVGNTETNIGHLDEDACFAGFISDKSGGILNLHGTSLFPMQVLGDFTLKNNNTLNIDQADLIVGGLFKTELNSIATLQPFGSITADESEIDGTLNMPASSQLISPLITVNGSLNMTSGGDIQTDDLTLNGLLNINNGNVLIHQDFLQSAGGHLILNAGSVVIDKPYTGAMFGFAGTTDLNGGFFEISNEGIIFGTGAIVNFNGGNLRIGGHFTATNPNSFQPSYGAVEFINTIGSNINLSNGNYFHKLIINKSSTNPCYPLYDLIINDDLEITSGEFQTLNNTLSIGDDLVIGTSGKLMAGSSTINVDGDWINNRGSAGFAEGTSSVWLNSSQPCVVSTETFYNLDMDKALGWNQFADLAAGAVLTISNKLTIGDGSLRMNNNCTLNLNGDLHLKSGGGLNANAAATGTVINCYGNWEDYNTGWSPFAGFAAGQSTTYLKGSQVQEFNGAGGVRFYNLVIQKTAESFIPYFDVAVVNSFQQISGQWRQSATNLDFTFSGLYTISNPSLWLDPVNTVIFDGTSSQELIIETPGWLILGSLVVDKSTDAGILDIQTDISCGNKMKVIRGEAAFDGYRLQCTDSLAVFQDGTLNFTGGSSIGMGNNGNICISGGNLNLSGSATERLTVSRSSTGYYEFLVENGGHLQATYTDFEYIIGRGLDFEGTGILGGAMPLNFCSFSKGEPGGTLLTLNNSQDVTLNNVIFPTNSWSGTNNVSKTENTGDVYLPDASGDFAGPAFEFDPYGRIHWPSAGIWDGDVSTQWHNAQNWRYNFQIPDASTDVVIPAGRPYYPVFSNQDTTVSSILMEPNTSLTIQKDTIRVSTFTDIAGTLNMTGDNTGLFTDSLVWQSGSSASMVEKATIYISGDMFIRRGSNLNLSNGLIYYYGTGESNLICHDTAQIFNLSNYKMNPFSLSLVGDTLAQLTINGNFTNGNATTLRCPSSQEWVFNGNFRNTANGHFRFSNGTIKLRGAISSTYFRLKQGDYFNNLIIETPSRINLYYTTGYSDTLRVNGDLTINPRSGGTSGIQANQFKMMMRGDWINNAGTSAFVTGAGQTHSVIFWEPFERQEIRGNTNFMTIGIANESDDGVHFYNQVTAISLIVTNPVWSHGTFTVNSADIDDNLSAIHLTDGSVMQIGNLNQGGVIHVHNGDLTVNDLNQSYITGSYVIDNGSMELKQSEYTTTHDLYFANLTINGGMMKFSGGNGQSNWPSVPAAVSNLTMTGGIFYLMNHSVEILPGSFTENISGGTIRLPGNFIGDAGVTSFHPTGGIVELYDDWDVDCGFLEPSCWFHDLHVTKSGDAGVVPFYGIRVKNHLKINEGYLQLFGNPVVVGP